MSQPSPKLTRFSPSSLIWLVPLAALGFVGWMFYHEWSMHGTEITIEFADGSRVEPHQTKLEYRGINVGEVKAVSLDRDLRRVIVRLQLTQDAAALARRGSMFWVVHPEIGISGVSGLETLLTGARLGVRPGAGPPATHFVGLESAPAPDQADEGRAFLLRTERIGGLQPHAPVLYRDVKVGEVETTRLTDDATGVLVRIRIEFAYVALVHANTRFWNSGGSPIEFSLFGSGSEKRSLSSVVTGAISFATPDEAAPVAPADAVFKLYDSAEGEWLKWHPVIPIQALDSTPVPASSSKVVPSLLNNR